MKFYSVKDSSEATAFVENHGISSYFYPQNLAPESRLVFSENTLRFIKRLDSDISPWLRLVRSETIPIDVVHSCRQRVRYSTHAILEKPIDDLLFEELMLYLWTSKHPVIVEYLGRGSDLADKNKVTSINAGSEFILDIAGGKRTYRWRIVSGEDKTNANVLDFPEIQKWFADEEARIVVSLGGGGFRCFGLCTILKVFNLLGLRDDLDEIWGTSGGAIAGFLYGLGVDPNHIESLGYDLYHEKYEQVPFRRSRFQTLFHSLKTVLYARRSERIGRSHFQQLLAGVLSDVASHKIDKAEDLPFYAVASSLTTLRSLGLTGYNNFHTDYSAFIQPMEPFESVVSSAALPFIFRPRKLKDLENKIHYLIDGGVCEETPLYLPLKKWLIDRRSGREKRTKLKIFFVDLSSRYSHTKRVMREDRRGLSPSFFSLATRVLDMLLYQSRDNFLDLVTSMENLDVLGVVIHAQGQHMLDVAGIPKIIKLSRPAFVASLGDLENQLRDNSKGPGPKLKFHSLG